MVRWRYWTWTASMLTPYSGSAQQVVIAGDNYDVLRFNVNAIAGTSWRVPLEHNQYHLKPEWSLSFMVTNGVVIGNADWHIIDRASLADGATIAAPNHDNKILHAVTNNGARIWNTAWIADASVVQWLPGDWVPIRVQRQAALDTITDSLDLFSISMRYRVRG